MPDAGDGQFAELAPQYLAQEVLGQFRNHLNLSRPLVLAEMLPAVGQGIVAVECAARDWETRRLLALIDDPAAHACADAEREVLWVLNGHCNSPIAGFATIEGMEMSLTASVLDEAGQLFIEASRSGPADRPRELGRTVGLELLQKGAADIIERSRPR